MPGGDTVKDKEIKQTLVSMKILLDIHTNDALAFLPKENRIKINGTDTRVLKIKINTILEEL